MGWNHQLEKNEQNQAVSFFFQEIHLVENVEMTFGRTPPPE